MLTKETVQTLKALEAMSTQGEWLVYENTMRKGKVSIGIKEGWRGPQENGVGEDYTWPVLTVGHPLGNGSFAGEAETAHFIALFRNSAKDIILALEEHLNQRGDNVVE